MKNAVLRHNDLFFIKQIPKISHFDTIQTLEHILNDSV